MYIPYKPDYETVKNRYNSKPMSKKDKTELFQKIVLTIVITLIIYILLFPLGFFFMEHAGGGIAILLVFPGLLVAAPLVLLIISAVVFPIVDYFYKNKKKF